MEPQAQFLKWLPVVASLLGADPGSRGHGDRGADTEVAAPSRTGPARLIHAPAPRSPCPPRHPDAGLRAPPRKTRRLLQRPADKVGRREKWVRLFGHAEGG
eukprot:gene14684-biopygen9176